MTTTSAAVAGELLAAVAGRCTRADVRAFDQLGQPRRLTHGELAEVLQAADEAKR